MPRPSNEQKVLQQDLIQSQIDLGAVLLRDAETSLKMAIEVAAVEFEDISLLMQMLKMADTRLKSLHLVLNKGMEHFDLSVSEDVGGSSGGTK